MNFKLLLLVAVVPTVLAAPVVANTITTQTRSFSLATLDDAPINGQTRNFANFNSFGLTGQTLTSVTLTAVYNINGRVVATNNATGGTAASRRRDVSASYELNATTTGAGFSLSGSNLASQTENIAGQGNDRTLSQLNPTFTLTQTLTSNLSNFLTGPVQISTDAFAVFASVPAADVVYGAPSITGGQAEFTLIYTAVPEPTTWAMLITGVGIAGATMRRRRVTAAVA